MNIWQAGILGLIQGLTEFLPVSSSGHLVILENIFDLGTDGGVFFEVLVHIGTLTAVVAAFWPEIRNLLRNPKQKITLLIIIGIIPAGIMGFFMEDFFSELFNSLLVVCLSLSFTGIILWLADAFPNYGGKDIEEISIWQALIIGFAQGIAITPGISRSGSTISAALFTGMNRESAAKYSFMISIPVILGAALVQLKDIGQIAVNSIPLSSYLAALLISALSGYWAIKVLLKLVSMGKLKFFSYYLWIVSLLLLIFMIF